MAEKRNSIQAAKNAVVNTVNSVTEAVAGASIAGNASAGGSDAKLLKDEETGEMVSKTECESFCYWRIGFEGDRGVLMHL